MLEELVDSLARDRREISREQYHAWRRDPVTEELFRDLTIALLRDAADPLPAHNDSYVAMHQRQGAKLMLEELQNWQPTSVRKEADHADA